MLLGLAVAVAALGAGPAGSPPASASPSSPAASAAVAPSASPTPSATPAPAYDAFLTKVARLRLDRIRAQLSLPGVSVAIVRDDGSQWLGVSGMANRETGARMTAGTAFGLASISKTFTAAVVMQLVDAGKLKLDGPVAPLLPGYALDRNVTVRMLLDHTSGLPDFYNGKGIDPALGDTAAIWTAAQSWSFMPKVRWTPGTVYYYSNANYLLLGELVRNVTGRTIADQIRTRLLKPLGLASMWFQGVEDGRAPLPAAYSVKPRRSGPPNIVLVAQPTLVMPFASVVTASGAAGSMAGTALDTARWMAALAGGHILPPATVQTMLDDEAVTVGLGSQLAYGLGLSTIKIDDQTAIGHSGRFLGVRNGVRYLPAQGLTIAVLTNQGDVDPVRVAASLLEILLPAPPEAWTPSAARTLAFGPQAR
jgi:CubicO group peptidase (beta-lactamase class C family)